MHPSTLAMDWLLYVAVALNNFMAGKGKRPERGGDWKKYYENRGNIKFPKKQKQKKDK